MGKCSATDPPIDRAPITCCAFSCSCVWFLFDCVFMVSRLSSVVLLLPFRSCFSLLIGVFFFFFLKRNTQYKPVECRHFPCSSAFCVWLLIVTNKQISMRAACCKIGDPSCFGGGTAKPRCAANYQQRSPTVTVIILGSKTSARTVTVTTRVYFICSMADVAARRSRPGLLFCETRSPRCLEFVVGEIAACASLYVALQTNEFTHSRWSKQTSRFINVAKCAACQYVGSAGQMLTRSRWTNRFKLNVLVCPSLLFGLRSVNARCMLCCVFGAVSKHREGAPISVKLSSRSPKGVRCCISLLALSTSIGECCHCKKTIL